MPRRGFSGEPVYVAFHNCSAWAGRHGLTPKEFDSEDAVKNRMERRALHRCITAALTCVVAFGCRQVAAPPAPPHFTVVEADISQMQAAMTAGELTSRQLCEMYLTRIARLNPQLHAIIETNPDALAIADALDAERRQGHVRGPLHGIPILLKDIIETKDRMETAAGSLVLVGVPVSGDAFVVERLRVAGAVVFGKANLTEWGGAGAQLGWSSRGGQTMNPYAADRSPLGSSAGSASAVTANLAAAALGGETSGSIVGPSSVMGVVGLKTTAGLVSRRGTVPAAREIDSIGPITKSVRDAALVLSAIADRDDGDPQATAADRPPATDYAAHLADGGLRGIRLGVVREPSLGADVVPLFDNALDDLRALGATLVDAEVAPELATPAFGDVLGTWFVGKLADSLTAYFRDRRPNATIHGVDEIVAANKRLASPDRPLERLGQPILEMAAKQGRQPAAARAKAERPIVTFAKKHGLEAMLARYGVDGFVSSVGPSSALNGPSPELPNMIG